MKLPWQRLIGGRALEARWSLGSWRLVASMAASKHGCLRSRTTARRYVSILRKAGKERPGTRSCSRFDCERNGAKVSDDFAGHPFEIGIELISCTKMN